MSHDTREYDIRYYNEKGIVLAHSKIFHGIFMLNLIEFLASEKSI